MSRLVVHRSVLDTYGKHLGFWKKCTACPLHKSARQKVFCRGVLPAHVLFLGEAPGAGEDDTGFPFVGDCGQVIDDIITDSIGAFNVRNAMVRSRIIKGTSADTTYARQCQSVGLSSSNPTIRHCLTNAVLCRPDNNETPDREAVSACSPRLGEFISICKPRLIVLVGKVADSAYIKSMKFSPEIIRTVSIMHPGRMFRQEDLGLEKARAAASILSGLQNLFNTEPEELPVDASVPIDFNDDEVPF